MPKKYLTLKSGFAILRGNYEAGLEEENTAKPLRPDWLKRISWAQCGWPFDGQLEAVVALRIERYLTSEQAQAELLQIEEIAHAVEISYSKEERQSKELTGYIKQIYGDLKIAKEFVREHEHAQVAGEHAGVELLRRIIERNRDARKGV